MKLKLALIATALVLSASTVEGQQVKRTLKQNVESCTIEVQRNIDINFDAYVYNGTVYAMTQPRAQFAFDKCMAQTNTPLNPSGWKATN